jgi:phosphatidylglycerol---prolipoprotein diacylglyceryl transferase
MTALAAAPLVPGTIAQFVVQSIPSPGQGVWHLGPVPLRAYALCIVAGIFAGYWLGRKRWVARGGDPEVITDIVMWAVPFGLVGSRIYHVITDYELYFGDGRDPLDALKIWHGGLGIWGGVAFGALGGWLACRRHKASFLAVADVLAPGIVLAQAIGRWGNYFNQELFGKPTTLPWGLEIDPDRRPEGYTQFATFHPTFLYEFFWCLGVMALVLLADRRFKLGHGRAFALYVAGYTAGRIWIETLRIDTVNHVAGLRLNVWTSIVLFVLAVGFFIYSARRWPGRGPLMKDGATTPDEKPAEQKSADEKSADEKSAEEKSEDEKLAGEKAVEEKGADEKAGAEAAGDGGESKDAADSAGETTATVRSDSTDSSETASGGAGSADGESADGEAEDVVSRDARTDERAR